MADIILTTIQTLPDVKLPVPILVIAPEATLDFAISLPADDILVDPWSAAELRFRIGRLVRGREWRFPGGVLRLHGSCVSTRTVEPSPDRLSDSNERVATSLDLSEAERAALVALLRAGEATLDRDQLAAVLGVSPAGRAVDMQISRLRKKLQRLTADWSPPLSIRSQRSAGYRLL